MDVQFILTVFGLWFSFTLFMWWLGIKTGELKGKALEMEKNYKEVEALITEINELKAKFYSDGEAWKLR